LIAADVAIGTNRPWPADVRADLEKRLAAAPVTARQETIEVATMVRPPDGKGAPVARMVELRGVQPGFPFYGKVLLQDGTEFTHALLANHGALVRPNSWRSLASRWAIRCSSAASRSRFAVSSPSNRGGASARSASVRAS
jgi:predicted lysophospholipase L1 biosynthesis ABC-type transport system permease subunit